MNRSRAADDFATIRQRLEELRREREAPAGSQDGDTGKRGNGRELDFERRRRERLEGCRRLGPRPSSPSRPAASDMNQEHYDGALIEMMPAQ